MKSTQKILSTNRNTRQDTHHSKNILNNDVIQKIFSLAHINCHTCQLVMTQKNVSLFKKHNSHYYCSAECFNHI